MISNKNSTINEYHGLVFLFQKHYFLSINSIKKISLVITKQIKLFMFVIEKIDQIEGQINFFKLTVNGECLLDIFIDACKKEGGLDSEIIQIQSRMQSFADMKTMPKTKLNPITPKKENYKEYEIKTKHLRVYFLHDKINGCVVVIGGKKTSQKKDIPQFRSIKNRYLKQLNDEK